MATLRGLFGRQRFAGQKAQAVGPVFNPPHPVLQPFGLAGPMQQAHPGRETGGSPVGVAMRVRQAEPRLRESENQEAPRADEQQVPSQQTQRAPRR